MTSNVALLAPVSPLAVAVKLYPDPALSTFRSVNVATPLAAVAVSEPPSVAPTVPVPLVMASPTVPANVVSGLPRPSCTATWTDGLMMLPAAAALGCPVKASLLGAPTVTSNAAVVAPASPAAPAANA